MRRWSILVLACVAASAAAQITVVSDENLPLSRDTVWNAPRFSPDGTRIYLTTTGYVGIWEFSRDSRSFRRLTADRGAGFGFAVSPDGERLAYRRTSPATAAGARADELVTISLPAGATTVQESAPRLSLPTFAGGALGYTVPGKELRLGSGPGRGNVALIGIEETKIAIVRNGRKEVLDPLGNGSYIWPALSPDRTRIVAYEMARGTFICDLAGRVTARLGRRDAPAWTRDGKWIVFVEEKNDGHAILESDLYMISVDGRQIVRLTDTPGRFEQNPNCSLTANTIVYSTMAGEIGILTYEEAGQ